jgi:hypothetical protein
LSRAPADQVENRKSGHHNVCLLTKKISQREIFFSAQKYKNQNNQLENHHSGDLKETRKNNLGGQIIMNDISSVLVAHCGARKVTRGELKEIPVPKGTKTHQPLSHFEIVEVLEEALSFRLLKVVRDEYAVSVDGMKMFGVMDLSLEFSGCRFSIGLRNSNDKSMRLALTAGYRVFVCDNMAFSGDFTPLFHKHTRNLSLSDAISIAVDRIHRGFEPLREQVYAMRDLGLTDEEAKLLIYRAFLDRSIKGIPRHLMPVVHDLYFKPTDNAFTPGNLWSLSNAFTSAFKKLAPVKQFEITARLGSYLSDVQESFKQNREISFSPQNKYALVPVPSEQEASDYRSEETFDEDDIAEDPYEEEFAGEVDEEAEIESIDEAEETLTGEYEQCVAA